VVSSPDLLIDPTFGLPTPPHRVPFQRTNDLIATVVMSAIGMIGLAFGFRDLVRARMRQIHFGIISSG
jgi:hypothetical protein